MSRELMPAKVGEEAHRVITILQQDGFKTSEIMAICLAASKVAESLIVTQGLVAVTANILINNSEK